MLLLDVSHTSHTAANTGIQRVCRKLHAELVDRGLAVGIVYDPYARHWRKLDTEERRLMAFDAEDNLGTKRKASWSKAQRWRGRWWRVWRAHPLRITGVYDSLIAPEFFSPTVYAAYSQLCGISGPQVAVFHDMIALHLPQFAPAKTLLRYPEYLRELARFDGIAAVSEFSRADMVSWWSKNNVRGPSSTITVHLASDLVESPPVSATCRSGSKKLLCVGSLEGRKNHVSLLDAAELLWNKGMDFELHLVGMVNRETGAAALSKVHALQAAKRPLYYHGAVTDASLARLYRESWCTIQASLMEGFGLPIIESLRHGVPCITTPGGSLGEVARGGGCLLLENATVDTIAGGIRRLSTEPDLYDRLRREISLRSFRSWWDYAQDISQYCYSLKPSA
ncbi:MAG: glycosyltransferase family 1 protein [Verrucomicrobiota bacterium]|nr:glycosyltransferase family 1 protein [Verrucomicrobiota bacterium]